MDIPRPDGPDVNRSIGIFIACWVLTAFVFVVLSFRFIAKAWVAWMLPNVSRPVRVWGYEDIFFAIGFAFDVGHMAMIWKSYESGLGRHFFYLSPLEKVTAMKWDFTSQPLAVAAAMFSRTGVIIFLYVCIGRNRRSLQYIVLTCMAVQVVVNLVTILQILLQCGPNPYQVADRGAYFHYMWDQLPEDGSVVCQEPTVQATVGFVQGAFNTVIDLTLTYLAGLEVWQFMFQTSTRGNQASFLTKFKNLEPRRRNQRLWQTILLCGPLLISAISSIVKTYLLSALGSRSDFTWNIVPFLLWVKIENYCIPIAATAPVFRLFVRTFIEQRSGDGSYMSDGPKSELTKNGGTVELAHRIHVGPDAHNGHQSMVKGGQSRDGELSSNGSEVDLVGAGGITVKHEYEVRVEERFA